MKPRIVAQFTARGLSVCLTEGGVTGVGLLDRSIIAPPPPQILRAPAKLLEELPDVHNRPEMDERRD
jgi:hypothetical protein